MNHELAMNLLRVKRDGLKTSVRHRAWIKEELESQQQVITKQIAGIDTRIESEKEDLKQVEKDIKYHETMIDSDNQEGK